MGCTLFRCSRGCSLCAGPPPFLQKKACMISYMKDVCNWTAGPMRCIYNSKQNTLEPVSSVSRPLHFLGKRILHIFKYWRSKTRQNTGYRSRYTFCISHEMWGAPVDPAVPLYQCVSGVCVCGFQGNSVDFSAE